MKKIVFIFFILLACTSKDTVSVIGSTNLSDNTNVYLVEYVQNRPILKDSTTVKNGIFSLMIQSLSQKCIIYFSKM